MNSHAEFPLLAQQLHAAALAPAEPPADLWTRIEQAHAQRVVRRTRWRYAGGALTVALLCALIGAGGHWYPRAPAGDETIDWQARAQALELQLAALDRTPTSATIADAGDVEADLARVDRLLQTAYEHDAYTNELVPLWKRRSELLNTLLVARKQGLALARI